MGDWGGDMVCHVVDTGQGAFVADRNRRKGLRGNVLFNFILSFSLSFYSLSSLPLALSLDRSVCLLAVTRGGAWSWSDAYTMYSVVSVLRSTYCCCIFDSVCCVQNE